MRASGLMTASMVKAPKGGILTYQSTLECSKKAKRTAQGSTNGPMVVTIKVILSTASLKATGRIISLISKRRTRAISRMRIWMVSARKSGRTARFTLVNSRKAGNTAKAQ